MSVTPVVVDPPKNNLTGTKMARFSIMALVYGFLYIPILVLIVFSFNKSRLNAVWTGFTMHWYHTLFTQSTMLHATWISLEVTIAQTIISTILGTMGGIALHRYHFWGKKAFIYFLYIPIVIPEIVMAVALLLFFHGIHFPLGVPAMIVGHTAFTIPYVVLVVRATMSGFDKTLEEAAKDLGANELQTLLRVTIPIILPGIIVGALLSFAQSFDDFTTSFFVDGMGHDPLPIYVFGLMRHGVSPAVNALSTLILVVTLSVSLFGEKLQRRGGVAKAN